ncbi:aspartyl-phosphate phosphatase Spo0E family protein [Shouchella shacheensis]|uniref:aspartyl-phosphate phosphatase Spo0E family protein n=1 Tax=Shouchella shacheensis TaxID=1649580 RepID=UPI00073FDCCF|nr:aspartyl-phosphate phosphatase Spo0E family protein [Shouchella shacheensis]
MSHSQNIQCLSNCIELVRMQLNSAASTHPLSSERVISLSRELDHLLNEYTTLTETRKMNI